MSQSCVAEFSTAPIKPEEADLLARLYHEIGVSAVAAALEILNMPSLSPETFASAFDGRRIPEPSDESLAA